MVKQLLTAYVPSPVKGALRGLQRQGRDAIALVREKTFRPYVTQKAVDGIAFQFVIGDLTGKQWYDGAFEYSSTELRFLREHILAPGDTVFDCGGHHGWNAIVLAHMVGREGRVVTFEPNPQNCAIIRRNLDLNGLTNIAVEQTAVGPNDQHAVVANLSDTIVKPDHFVEELWPDDCKRESVRRGIEVGMQSLDSYMVRRQSVPTVLKVDVEGYEVEVLRGARRVLSHRPKLCVEVHHPDALARYDTSVRDVFDMIDLSRYTAWWQADDQEWPRPFTDPVEAIRLGRRFHLYAVPQ